MSDVILFSTSGCHLCEEAEALLAQLDVKFLIQDIIDDPLLVEKYGIIIPVVFITTNNTELGWPFGLAELKQFLDS